IMRGAVALVVLRSECRGSTARRTIDSLHAEPEFGGPTCEWQSLDSRRKSLNAESFFLIGRSDEPVPGTGCPIAGTRSPKLQTHNCVVLGPRVPGIRLPGAGYRSLRFSKKRTER